MNAKLRHIVALCAVAPMQALAAAPDAIVGFIYYESGGTIARTSAQAALIPAANGTYQGLCAAGSSLPGNTITFVTSNPSDGTWIYRKIDDTHADLTLTDSGDAPPVKSGFTGTRHLAFTSPTAGDASVEGSSILGAVRFRIASVTERPVMLNCSNRSFVRAGGTAFTGFVLTADQNQTSDLRVVLVRAVGPGLRPFGVTDSLNDPVLSLKAASSTTSLWQNNDWADTGPIAIRRTSAFVGAFALPEGSKDAALVAFLGPGAWIAQVSSTSATDTGDALVEVYVLP